MVGRQQPPGAGRAACLEEGLGSLPGHVSFCNGDTGAGRRGVSRSWPDKDPESFCHRPDSSGGGDRGDICDCGGWTERTESGSRAAVRQEGPGTRGLCCGGWRLRTHRVSGPRGPGRTRQQLELAWWAASAGTVVLEPARPTGGSCHTALWHCCPREWAGGHCVLRFQGGPGLSVCT